MQICVESVCIQRHWLRVSLDEGSILHILQYIEACWGSCRLIENVETYFFLNPSGRMQICVESVCIQRHWLRVSRDEGSILHILQYIEACWGSCRLIEKAEAYFFLNPSCRMQICVESVCIRRHWLCISRDEGSILHILQNIEVC
jgi:hypothetical protein